jgi:hypothetical protein
MYEYFEREEEIWKDQEWDTKVFMSSHEWMNLLSSHRFISEEPDTGVGVTL